jgi:predicted HTH domain antitoxin
LKQDNSHGQDAAVGATTQPAYEKLEQGIESLEAKTTTKVAGYEQDIVSLKAAATVTDTQVTSYKQEIASLNAAVTVADTYKVAFRYRTLGKSRSNSHGPRPATLSTCFSPF